MSDPQPPADVGTTVAALLRTPGAPSFEATDLVRRLRNGVSPAIPPPSTMVGNAWLEARWWWAQCLTVTDEARGFYVRNLYDACVDAVALAINLAGRAVDTCPADHPDRQGMAASSVDLVLDACSMLPGLVGPDLGRILETVRKHCALLNLADAAPRRVRALPLALASGASTAEALVVLDEAWGVLRGQPMSVAVASAVRPLASLLAVLGDGDRAMAILADVEQGLEAAIGQLPQSPPLPDVMAANLEAVRVGRQPPPLDVASLTLAEAQQAEAALAARTGLANERVCVQADRAMALLDLGRPVEAVEALTALLADPVALPPDVVPRARLLRGIGLLESGDVEAAATEVEAAVVAAGDERAVGWPLVAYARARISAFRDEPSADAAFEFAAHLTDGTGIGWRTWAARADLLVNDPPAALTSYRNMAREIVRERRSSLGYRLDSTSLRDKVPHLAGAVRIAAEQDDWRSALELIETFKARQLQSVLADRTAGMGPSTDRLTEVERRIDALEFAPRGGAGPNPAGATELVTLRAERVAMLERRDWELDVIRDVRAALQATGPAPVDHIVEAVAVAGRAVVDLHLDVPSGRLTAVGLRDDQGAVGSMELSPAVLDGVLRRAANLRSASPDSLLYDPRATPSISIEELLPPAVSAMLDGAAHVIISPHGPLHLLPWAAIPLAGRRLLEGRAVSLVPSAWVLSTLPPPSGTPSGISCFGAPEGNAVLDRLGAIPGAAAELADLASLYERAGLTASAVTGAAATEQAFRDLVSRPVAPGTVLHVACHATTGPDGLVVGRPFLDGPEDPLAAALVLADAVLDADELRRLPLPFAEVVLSACSTGWRPTSVADVELAADSALGLVSSLLASGATSIVASLPRVDDEAAPTVLRRYHERRLAGEPPAVALCATQAALLGEGVLDPAVVLGFIAIGG